MSKPRGCLGLFFVLFVLAVCAAGAAGAWLLLSPYQGFSHPVFIEFERGSSSTQLAQTLEEEGVIRSRYLFLAWRALHPRAFLQAGEYEFTSPASVAGVYEKIRRGDIFFEELTVPEGSNMFDIANLLKGLRSFDVQSFVNAARDPSLMRDLAPDAPTLEGFLFPSTYRITRKTTGQDLCRAMTQEFRRRWTQLVGSQATRNLDVNATVTLASLVEKETGKASERPLVAAVFVNRLKQNMALQCDPTVVYASLRKDRYRGTIYRSDLTDQDPYNTYTHTGLPPGAIANPGVASLEAALHPSDANYLYFVAKPGMVGEHVFSSTLTQHRSAVEEYRKGLVAKP